MDDAEGRRWTFVCAAHEQTKRSAARLGWSGRFGELERRTRDGLGTVEDWEALAEDIAAEEEAEDLGGMRGETVVGLRAHRCPRGRCDREVWPRAESPQCALFGVRMTDPDE